MTGKERMIHILLLLKQNTGDNQHLTTAEIVRHFTDMGVPTDRGTVKNDIDTMIACGIDIVADKGTQIKYSYVDYPFELAELKLLIDAVEASKFITAEKSTELVQKLTSMTGKTSAEELKRQIYTIGRVKSENKSIFYVVDVIFRAINQKQKISFQYFEYNARKERIPRRDGEPYLLSPYTMLYNEDRYYVLGFSETHGKIVTFRVDRMGVPKLLPEPIRPEPEGFDPVDYTVNIFSMYDGEMQTVRLLCENRLMNNVIDQFGDEFSAEIADNEHFTAEVEVSVSQTFYAWVFQFAGAVRIIGPENVLHGYREMLDKAK